MRRSPDLFILPAYGDRAGKFANVGEAGRGILLHAAKERGLEHGRGVGKLGSERWGSLNNALVDLDERAASKWRLARDERMQGGTEGPDVASDIDRAVTDARALACPKARSENGSLLPVPRRNDVDLNPAENRVRRRADRHDTFKEVSLAMVAVITTCP